MAGFIQTYGGNLDTMAHSGLAAVRRAEAAGLSIGQIQNIGRREGINWGNAAEDYFRQKEQTNLITQFTNQITGIQNSMQQQIDAQKQQTQQAQENYQKRIEEMQQQYLQAQTRQSATPQAAQVAAPSGSLSIRRAGAAPRFNRPELRITSMNI